MDRATYRTRKAAIEDELAALPDGGGANDKDAGKRLAGFLADVAAAWTVATPEERNRLARQLFGEAIVENRTLVAVKPRPDLRPFFEAIGPEKQRRRPGRIRIGIGTRVSNRCAPQPPSGCQVSQGMVHRRK